MVTMLKSDVFQRIAGGFVLGAMLVVVARPEGAASILDALRAVAGLA